MKVILKLKKRSPKGYMKLGKHKVTLKYETFDVDKKEQATLMSDKGKVWFTVKPVKKEK